MTAVVILDSVTADMEILDRRSSDPLAAFHAGEAEARKYTAMGYTCRCVGVVRTSETWYSEKETGAVLRAGQGLGYRETRCVSRDGMAYYRPVIQPRLSNE